MVFVFISYNLMVLFLFKLKYMEIINILECILSFTIAGLDTELLQVAQEFTFASL